MLCYLLLVNCIFLRLVKNTGVFLLVFLLSIYITTISVVEPEPVLFGRSRSRCEGPAPAAGSGSTLDRTEEILNDILSVRFNIY